MGISPALAMVPHLPAILLGKLCMAQPLAFFHPPFSYTAKTCHPPGHAPAPPCAMSRAAFRSVPARPRRVRGLGVSGPRFFLRPAAQMPCFTPEPAQFCGSGDVGRSGQGVNCVNFSVTLAARGRRLPACRLPGSPLHTKPSGGMT
jgi:hypothetical protein